MFVQVVFGRIEGGLVGNGRFKIPQRRRRNRLAAVALAAAPSLCARWCPAASTPTAGADEARRAARHVVEGAEQLAEFVGALEVIGKMYETLGPILQDYNLLVTPTTGLPAVPADFDQSTEGLRPRREGAQ